MGSTRLAARELGGTHRSAAARWSCGIVRRLARPVRGDRRRRVRKRRMGAPRTSRSRRRRLKQPMAVQRGETSQLLEILERVADGGVQVDLPHERVVDSSPDEEPAPRQSPKTAREMDEDE